MSKNMENVKGGWTIIKGERRFVPLKVVNVPKCKSCLHFRKGYGGYCTLNPDTFTTPETEACEGYVNRTYWRGEMKNEMR
ncbi:MAG: hypothetical protein QXH03_02620 [Candidatus Bathyarchaeia archaeon]